MAAGRLAAGQGAALLSASSECRCRPGKAPILREQRCPTAAQRTPQHPPHHPPLPTGRAGGFGCTRDAKLSLRPPTELICTRRVVTPPPHFSPPAAHGCPPRLRPAGSKAAAPAKVQRQRSSCRESNATRAARRPHPTPQHRPSPRLHPALLPSLHCSSAEPSPIAARRFPVAPPPSRCTGGCAAVNALCVNRRAVFARPLLSAAGMGKRGGGEEGVGAPLCEPLRAPTSG